MSERTVSVRYLALIDTYKAALAEGGLANKAFSESVGSAISQVGSHFGSFGTQAGKSLGGVVSDLGAVELGGAAVSVVIAGLAVKGIKSFLELGAQVRSFQLITGASAKDASEFVGVFNEMGIDFTTAGQGILRLNASINAHADVLARDGIEIAKNKNGTTDLAGTLLNVADAYQRAGGGAAGLTIAQDVFSTRSARSMLPLLQLTRAELQKLFAEVAAHGGLLNQGEIDGAYQAHLAMRGLGEAVQGLERELGGAFVPALTDTAKWLADVVDWLRVADEWTWRLVKDMAAMPHVGVFAGVKISGDANAATTDQLVSGYQKLQSFGSGADFQNVLGRQAPDAAARLQEALKGIDATKAAQKASLDLAVAEDDLAASQETATAIAKREAAARVELADKTTLYKAALGQVTDSELKGMETQDAYQKGLVDFANTIKQAEQDGDKFARSLDASTDAGLTNRAALDGLARSALDHAMALQAQGAGADRVAAALAGDEGELVALGQRLGLSQNDLAPWIRVMQDAAWAARDFSFAASQALSNPALAGLINATQYLGIYSPPKATPLPSNVAGAASGANVTVKKDTAAAAQDKAVADYLKAVDDANKQQIQVEDFQWQHGFITNERYKQILDARLANAQTFSQDWQAALTQQDALYQREADAAQAAADAQKKAADDQAAALKKQNDDLLKSLQQQETTLSDALKTLQQRRDDLFAWADPSQKVSLGWANSTSALTKNIKSQTDQLREWGSLMAQLESRGLSASSIDLLGLDKGPSSLAELRKLAGSSASDLAGLNASVAQRSQLAQALAIAQPAPNVLVQATFLVDGKSIPITLENLSTALTQLKNEEQLVGATSGG